MENLNFFRLLVYRLYHFFFKERFSKKLEIEFPKNIFRWDLIQYIINKHNFKDYLEIGCDKDQSFPKIQIKNKVGVDPISGGTIRSTSNEFFQNNNDSFDLIFIDGLHHYKQVLSDIENSLKVLNDNGFILVHDCLPKSLAQQAVPRYRGYWNGDVWKSIVKLRTKNDLDITTCQIDFGISVIRKKPNNFLLELNNISDFEKLKFKDYYYNHRVYMNIKSYEETLKLI